MEFDIEYYYEITEEKPNPWYALTDIDPQGNVAIGSGYTVWEAIGNCIANIEPARKNLAFVQEVLNELKPNIN